MEGKGLTQLFCFLYISFWYSEHYGIILDLKDAVLFYNVFFVCVHIHHSSNTLCMHVMCLTSLTDSFDDRQSQYRLI